MKLSSSLVDRILSVAAIISAIAAVAIAVYEAHITRAHQKASVWPYVRQYNTGVQGVYTREVENVGLGPALIRSVQVRVDGQVRTSWREVIHALTGEEESDFTYGSFGRGSVLLPGRPYRMLVLPWDLLGRRVHREVNADRLSTRICYCSVYGDCWVDESTAPEPEPVGACEPDPALEFRE